MAIKFEGSQPKEARVLFVILAILNWVLAAMLFYLRWFPLEHVFRRFEERGAELPAWLSLLVTAGTVFIAGFLAFRGWRFMRRALAG